MPAFSIVLPANMKKGIANSVNLPIAAYMVIGNRSNGNSATNKAIREDVPKLKAIGTFKNNSAIKDINSIAATDIIVPPWL